MRPRVIPGLVLGLLGGEVARAMDPWSGGLRCNGICCFDRAIGPNMVLQVCNVVYPTPLVSPLISPLPAR